MQVTRLPDPPSRRTDYETVFETTPVDAGDARAWAAAVFGGAPGWFRLVMRVGWRLGLRLRLDGQPDLLGWPVADDRTVGGAAAGTVRMVAHGPLVDAANVVSRTAGALRWTTTVDYRSPVGRLIWSLAAPVHHRTLPWLIRRAADRISADPVAADR